MIMNDEKPPPHDQNAEMSILSSMLNKAEIFIPKAQSEGLLPSMFYNTAHRSLYETLLGRFVGKEEPIEPVTLLRALRREKKDEAIGGASYLAEVAGYAPTNAHFDEHLQIVKETCALRKGIQLSAHTDRMIEEGATIDEVMAAIESQVEDIKSVTVVRQCFLNATQAMERFMATMNNRMDSGEMPGTPTGIRELDLIGGGMRDGEFWVICGETSAGKSALSYQMMVPAINDGKRVLIFTLEMGADEVFSRLISCRGRVNLGAIMNPRGISKGDGMAIRKQAQALAGSQMMICDEANMTIDYVCAQSEQQAEDGSVDAIVVDYIQLLDGGGRRGESREQELSRISKRLKQLAKKLGCPVITPAQLNDDGKLRESRAIGQDADVVLKISDSGIKVAKFRNAARDQLLPLILVGQFQRFETYYEQQQ